MINLDNAATTGKKPQMVINAVNNALYNLSANPGRGGHLLSANASEAVYSVRNKVAKYFGASAPDRVVFTANCTASVNYVIKGFLKPGDHIIISDLEHNAVVRPLKKTGADVSVAEVDLNSNTKTVENFKRLVRDDTKMIFCTAASNVCGRKLPLDELGSLCKSRGIAFGVDAAQVAGIVPVDMQKTGIDYLCIAPHKGLYAPMGLGILIAERDIGDTIIEGGTGTNSLSYYQPQIMPERYESGTLNLPAVMGASAGIDFVERHAKNAYFKENGLIKRLYGNLKKMPNVKLFTPGYTDELYMPVLSFNIKGKPSEQVAAYLDSKGIAVRAGLHCAPLAHKKLGTIDSGTVRISPSYFNTPQEIDYLLRVLKLYK